VRRSGWAGVEARRESRVVIHFAERAPAVLEGRRADVAKWYTQRT
jgi:hypothetical protein